MDVQSYRASPDQEPGSVSLLDLAIIFAENMRTIVGGSLIAGGIALGASFLIKPVFTATSVILPPQQQQSAAAAAIQSLGALAGVAGAVTGVKNPVDQYVALLQSARVSDRIIDRFSLMDVYSTKYREDARKALDGVVTINAGKKDGLISISVDDIDPKRASDIANQYIEELKTITTELAVTEAQQRRLFFENQLKTAKVTLIAAQEKLQSSGINEGAMRADPEAAAAGYARLKAEVATAEIRLKAIKTYATPQSFEVKQAQDGLNALRAQLAKTEQPYQAAASSDYISKYREFKYQETLFELLSKQFEMAKIDESRDGLIVQVLDAATPPERKSKPKKAQIAVITAVGAGIVLTLFVILRHSLHLAETSNITAEKIKVLRSAVRRKTDRSPDA